jgi:hypothetical protein
MDHLQKLKKHLLDQHDFELPDGWEVRYSQRRKEGARPDPYYYSPDHDKNNLSSPLRSIPNVEQYLGLSQTSEKLPDASHIYILTTESFPEVKIGESIHPIQRARELNTGVPYKFKIYRTFKSPFPTIKNKTTTSSCKTKKLEDIFHARYAHVRAPNGEFFDIDPDMVTDEFEVDLGYLTKCQEHTPELADEYLDLMLEEAKLKSKLDGMNA